MAKLRMAHASTHGARKPSGPKNHKPVDKTKYIYLILKMDVYFEIFILENN